LELNNELLKQKENLILDFLFYWMRPIRAGDLAKELNIKHSTLNSVLHRLEQQFFITWSSYGPIALTESGKEYAFHLSKHHWLIERFLKSTLDLTDTEVHQEALHLAGAVSCRLIESICNKLNITDFGCNYDQNELENYSHYCIKYNS
jgi:Mn-dependent DtxR family transcriptional regulator